MDLIIIILPVVTKDLPVSPRFTPYDFLSRCKFSTLTTRQPMYVELFQRFSSDLFAGWSRSRCISITPRDDGVFRGKVLLPRIPPRRPIITSNKPDSLRRNVQIVPFLRPSWSSLENSTADFPDDSLTCCVDRRLRPMAGTWPTLLGRDAFDVAGLMQLQF